MTSPYTVDPGGLLRCCVQAIDDYEIRFGTRTGTAGPTYRAETICRVCGAKLERDEQRVWRWVREGE